MNGYLKQSTASQARAIGPFLDDTDFKTAETGLTIANTDIKLRANGTTLSNKNSGGGTHQVNGVYAVTWDATDTANVGELHFSVVVAGALPVFGTYVVLEEAVYDALFAASAPGYVTDQPVNTTKFGGTTVTGRDLGTSVLLSSGTGTGQVKLAAGYVAPNWGDVGNPTTTVGLSGTTVKTATDVETDTQDLQSRIPAALTVDGNIKADTLRVGGTLQTAGDIIGDTNDLQTRLPAALVSGRIDASVGAMAANVLTATAINADAITAAKIADGAIDAATFAAGALDAVWSTATRTLTAIADSSGVTTLLGKLAGITVLAEWLGLLAGKQSGNATARTELRATGAGSGTFDETTDSLEAVRDRGDAAYTTVAATAIRSAVGLASADLDTQLAALPTAGETADQVWEEALSDHSGTVGSTAEALAGASAPSAAAVADAVWEEAIGDHAGTVGSTAEALAGATAPTAAAVADAVWEEAIADHSGTAGSTAEQLAAAGAAGDPWATNIPGAYTGVQAGKVVGDALDAAITSRASQASVDTIDGIVDAILLDTAEIGTAGAGLTNINLPDQTMNITGSITGNLSGSVGSVTAGVTLADDAITAGTFDELTAFPVQSADTGSTALARTGADGDTMETLSDQLDTKLSTAGYTAPPSVGAIADQVWDEALAGHLGAGSAGEHLSNAGAAGTPPTVVEIADEVETRALTLTSAERTAIADAHLDRANAIETGLTVRGAHRLIASAVSGTLSGASTTTVTIRNAVADSKDRITATVDTAGNRTAVTTDVT